MVIAFLGTGLLGTGFVTRLREQGHEVAAWNRTAARAAPLAATGARIASSPSDAVRGASRVHLCLSADAAVDAVLAEAAPGLETGAVIVDHTTTSPAGTKARAARFAAAGRDFVHAPVFMSPQAARAGKGLMLASGPEQATGRVEQGLRAMTGELWIVGERTDLAAAYKLFGNAMLSAVLTGLADVFTMARGLGVAPADTLALFDHFQPCGTIPVRGVKMARGDFAPSFALTMARKDLGLMVDAAAPAGAPLTFIPALLARVDALIARGHGADDLGVLAVDAVAPR